MHVWCACVVCGAACRVCECVCGKKDTDCLCWWPVKQRLALTVRQLLCFIALILFFFIILYSDYYLRVVYYHCLYGRDNSCNRSLCQYVMHELPWTAIPIAHTSFCIRLILSAAYEASTKCSMVIHHLFFAKQILNEYPPKFLLFKLLVEKQQNLKKIWQKCFEVINNSDRNCDINKTTIPIEPN